MRASRNVTAEVDPWIIAVVQYQQCISVEARESIFRAIEQVCFVYRSVTQITDDPEVGSSCCLATVIDPKDSPESVQISA
jgi:hypothetical protein